LLVCVRACVLREEEDGIVESYAEERVFVAWGDDDDDDEEEDIHACGSEEPGEVVVETARLVDSG